MHGDTPLVRALIKSGATERWPPVAMAASTPAATVRAAIERSLPLLDRADVAFIQKAGCISCHNNSLAALTREAVRAKSIRVNEPIASSQTQAMAAILAGNRERALQALGLPGRGDTVGYILLGMAAANYPSNEITDAWARYMKNLQQADGRWRVQAQRPPIESNDIQATATALKGIQTYAPPSRRDEYQRAVQLAALWLETATAKSTEERAF